MLSSVETQVWIIKVEFALAGIIFMFVVSQIYRQWKAFCGRIDRAICGRLFIKGYRTRYSELREQNVPHKAPFGFVCFYRIFQLGLWLIFWVAIAAFGYVYSNIVDVVVNAFIAVAMQHGQHIHVDQQIAKHFNAIYLKAVLAYVVVGVLCLWGLMAMPLRAYSQFKVWQLEQDVPRSYREYRRASQHVSQ